MPTAAPPPERLAALARELGIAPEAIAHTLSLAAEGATVPFLARYRKEATGGLDEVQIQSVLDRAAELAELDLRRTAIVRSIEEQGEMTPALAAALAAAKTKAELEDLYLPFRPKRKTRATIARGRGLEPLADLLWAQEAPPGARLEDLVAPFVRPDAEVPDVAAALAGARDICAERVAEDASLRAMARGFAQLEGTFEAEIPKSKRKAPTKFDTYDGYREPLEAAPSHRVLAVLRGEAEDVLRARVGLPDDRIVTTLVARVVTKPRALFAPELRAAVADAWERLLRPSLETELRGALKERADREAIEVFGQNLRHLLLAAPVGGKRLVALDPGLRTGVKLAALDETGKVLHHTTLATERGASERARAVEAFGAVLSRVRPELIAVGSGTGSREAEAFVREVLCARSLCVPVVSVSEQGASIYSASEVAREELPDLDVSIRGAVSIGRRLQDPLAELVKIDPKSIGVGQYQHDVDGKLLGKKLAVVVEHCVNQVGVDVNTASPALLAFVAGIGPGLARKIVVHRDAHGAFVSREALRRVPGLGPKAFEQAAGFLRVRGGHPLDDSAVHPERYDVVARMARDLETPLESLVGDAALVGRIDPRRYLAPELGEPTLRDILGELRRPGRDPRGDFSAPAFRADLSRLEDVKEGMVLEGSVTNVTAFGAFVDVGVHQDGLVHVSQLANRFVKDPAEVVKVGDRVRVKVVSVDLARKRLGLSIRQAGG
jgi:uncharacterized protein